jgi:hypothetical protein
MWVLCVCETCFVTFSRVCIKYCIANLISHFIITGIEVEGGIEVLVVVLYEGMAKVYR